MARISIVDAYQRLGISRSMLYLHIKSGKLTTFKDGARTFVHEVDLLALERGGQAAELEEPRGGAATPADAQAAAEAWQAAVADGKAQAAATRAADIDAIAKAVAKKLRP